MTHCLIRESRHERGAPRNGRCVEIAGGNLTVICNAVGASSKEQKMSVSVTGLLCFIREFSNMDGRRGFVNLIGTTACSGIVSILM